MKKTIGQMIEEAFNASGMSKNEFADKICCSRQNVYSIFKKENIDIDSLMRISKVLEHDFLLELSSQPKQEPEQEPERKTFCVDGKWMTKSEYKERVLQRKAMKHETYCNLANAYLSGKARTPLYYVTLLTEFTGEVEHLICLTQDEINALRKVTLEEGCYLTDVIDWSEKIDTVDIGYGELREVIKIDFTPRYLYTFTCYELQWPTKEPTIEDYCVELTDEQYLRLLVLLLESPGRNMDYLRDKESDLYHKIYEGAVIPSHRSAPMYPYLVFMTEPLDDVVAIRKDYVEDDEPDSNPILDTLAFL